MFFVQIEKADGTIFYFGKKTGGVFFDTEESADEIAEGLWSTYNCLDTYARFSVVDETGERLTDWEV
jgi:hypothetical protein